MTEHDITGNLRRVEERIAAACARAGRARAGVSVVAVSKTHGPAAVRVAMAAGLQVFGENRVQEADQKIPRCPAGLIWHLVGHLQSNKVARAGRLFDMVHSVDSLAVLRGLDAAAAGRGCSLPVCLQVNVSGERTKSGLAPDAVEPLLLAAAGLRYVDVVGLMTIPPFSVDPEPARPAFAALRDLRDRLRAGTGFPLEQLSMGMSGDFEVAIEEGATWVRLGTVLFGPRQGRTWRADDGSPDGMDAEDL